MFLRYSLHLQKSNNIESLFISLRSFKTLSTSLCPTRLTHVSYNQPSVFLLPPPYYFFTHSEVVPSFSIFFSTLLFHARSLFFLFFFHTFINIFLFFWFVKDVSTNNTGQSSVNIMRMRSLISAQSINVVLTTIISILPPSSFSMTKEKYFIFLFYRISQKEKKNI